MHPHPLVGPYSPSLAGHKVIKCVTHSLAPFMALIVDEIEEEEDGGRRGRRKRTKLMKESKQQIRKGSRKQVMTGMVVRTNEQEFHPRVNK